MNTLVIGATGKVGGYAVDHLVQQGAVVRVFVRNRDKAETRFASRRGLPKNLGIVAGELDDDDALTEAARGADAVFLVLGPICDQGYLQHHVIRVLARAQVPQLLRLSVLSARHDSHGVNQRGHAALDCTARREGVGYTSLRPAVFTTAITDVADEISATDGWTGSAPTGRNPFIDPRDVGACAATVLLDRSWWGQQLDLTGPVLYTWPEVAEVLTAELGRPISYRVAGEDAVVADALRRGLPAVYGDVLVARDQAAQAGENDLLTDTVQRLTGNAPRTLPDYVHEHRGEFLPATPA